MFLLYLVLTSPFKPHLFNRSQLCLRTLKAGTPQRTSWPSTPWAWASPTWPPWALSSPRWGWWGRPSPPSATAFPTSRTGLGMLEGESITRLVCNLKVKSCFVTSPWNSQNYLAINIIEQSK